MPAAATLPRPSTAPDRAPFTVVLTAALRSLPGGDEFETGDLVRVGVTRATVTAAAYAVPVKVSPDYSVSGRS